jgi:hypothetical protein
MSKLFIEYICNWFIRLKMKFFKIDNIIVRCMVINNRVVHITSIANTST